MPVSLSHEPISSDSREKVKKKFDEKFTKPKNENLDSKLFRKRKKFYYTFAKIKSKPLKVLNLNSEISDVPEKNLKKKRTISETSPKTTRRSKKRKINLEKDPEGGKFSDFNMYEYRPATKTESESSFLPKNDSVDENLILNGQNCLGGANNSIATLCNIGNSCYLNSVVYTLRFAPHFLHKLHHLVDDMRHVYLKISQHKTKSSSLGRNVSGLQSSNGRSWSSKDLVSLNAVNPINGMYPVEKSNRQIATEKLHELYQSLHRNESIDTGESYHAGIFLSSIQDVSSIFEGNQQQDAHELFLCILDSLRETCSTLIKTIKENPEVMNNNTEVLESSELSNANGAQSLKSIFSRKIRRKDAIKNNGGSNSPIKENLLENSTNEKVEPKKAEKEINNVSPEANGSESKDFNEAIKRLGLDFFCKDFEGITLFTTKCLTCETVTEQKETMVDIAIPISHDNTAQPVDPQLFFQNSCITREYFRVENHFRCDKCCGYTEAVRSISFEVLPRLLVLHIKRFSGGMEKISTYSPTPFILKCFCNKCFKKRDEEKLHFYKLYSVITHVGATMSVGHYIAYTCSLDIYNEYVNCCYGKRKLSVQSNNAQLSNQQVLTEKNSGLMKKLIYGRNKASSSGDMSKNLKPINGFGKMMINGIEKLSLNSDKNSGSASNGVASAPSSPPRTFCSSSANCCGIYVKNFSTLVENYQNSGQQEKMSSEEKTHENEISQTSKSSSNDLNQKIWYMCDDDKIKVMTQREFEEILSRNQKVMITPYLLFYARYDAAVGSNA